MLKWILEIPGKMKLTSFLLFFFPINLENLLLKSLTFIVTGLRSRGGDIIYSVFQTYFIQNSFLRQSYWNIKCCCLFNLQFYLAYTSQILFVLTRGENLVSCNTTTFWSVCIIKILMHKIKFWLHKYYWTMQ